MTIAVGIGSEWDWFAPTLFATYEDAGSGGSSLSERGGNIASVNALEQAPTGGGGTSVAWFSNGSDNRGVGFYNTLMFDDFYNTTGKNSLSFWMLPEAKNGVVTVGTGLYLYDGTPAEVRLNCGRDSNGDMYASFESGGSVLLNANLGSGTTHMIHVAMVWDDNVRAAIYKNGVLVAEDTTVGTWKLGNIGGALMASTTSASLYSGGGGGYIDDFRFYRSILSELQITHLATERKVLGTVGLGGEKLWLSPSVGHSSFIAMDMSGTSNNGTYQNEMGFRTIADTSSGGTRAFDFDGTADRIDCPSTILGGSQVFSMACWIYVDSHDTNYGQGYMGQIELGYPPGSNDVAALYSGGGNTNPDYVSSSWRSITAAGGSYQYTFANGYSPPTGSWHHLACVANGSVNTLYVDGVAQNYPSSYTGSFPTPSNYFQIGRYGSSNNGCLDGRMDDVRVYHRALNQAEITHLATSRGILGSPLSGTYNPFQTFAFDNNIRVIR